MALPARLQSMVPGVGSLGRRALKAGGWTLLQLVAQNVLRLCSNLIMTRLLMPEAFGLIAFVSTLIVGFHLLTDIGIHRSIMREPDGSSEHFLLVAWVVKIGRGLMIASCVLASALILWILGPQLAAPGTVYADARLPGLIALSTLIPVMMGFEATTKELSTRNLAFARLTLLAIGAQIISILAMLSFALASQTVWALMAGMLVGHFVNMIGSHLIFQGPQMRYAWDAEISDRLWQYGRWLMGSSTLTFLAFHADKLVLGALLNTTAFGLYAIALIWVDMGRLVIDRLVDQVGFPTLSAVIRERPQDVSFLYPRFQRVADILCLMGFVVSFAVGPWLIQLLYTESYHSAGQFVGLLSLSFLSLRFNPLGGLLMNLGDSRAMMIISAFRAAGLIGGMTLGYSTLGLSGAVLAVAISPLASAPYTLAKIKPVLGQSAVRLGYFWIAGTLALAAVIYSQVTF